ncbi:unnamed protein product [Effrenium voratum]|nr:unnamed protein product [Effrenium voratum]
MGLQIIQHQTFARHLIALIGSPSVNLDVVLDTVLEVLRRSAGAFMIYEPAQSAAPALQSILAAVTQAMSQLLPTLQQHAASAAVLEEEDAQRLARWAEVAGSLIEAYTQLLWLDPETSEVLLRFIAACFMVHPRVGQAVSELWAILKDAKRDGKLPENVMPKILHRLVEPSVLSFTRFGRFDSKFTDDRADLVQLRSAQQDILVDMYCVAAGTAEAQLVLGTLLKPLESGDILGQEVVWYAFQGIAEVIADEPSIPNEYNVVLPSVFRVTGGPAEALATGAALLRACGPHFEQRLQAHLAPAVQWLVSMVAHVPNEASETVQELCGYAGKLLLPHLEEFLKVVDQVAPKAPAEVDACLYGALAGIARNLPAEQAAAGFAKVCNSTAATLQGIDTSSEAGRMALHRVLGRILRCPRGAERFLTSLLMMPRGPAK